jgi:hypothetical protein
VPHPTQPARKIVTRRIWRKTTAVVYNPTTKRRIGALPLFTFSSQSAKDLLMEYMTGLVGDWTIPERTAREYLKQVTAERREQRTDPKGAISYFWHRYGDNHYFDCEQMILIAALITKVIIADVSPGLRNAVTKPLPPASGDGARGSEDGAA